MLQHPKRSNLSKYWNLNPDTILKPDTLSQIFEKSNNIGGSWALTNTAKYKNLEIAHHILPGREINTLSKFELPSLLAGVPTAINITSLSTIDFFKSIEKLNVF